MSKFLFCLLFVGVFSIVGFGQELPDVPDNPDLRDNNIRLRSVELERIKRDADKGDAANAPTPNKDLNAKFPEILKDHTGIQKQRALLRDYINDQNMKMLRKTADRVTKHAKNLHKNLFVDKIEKKKEDSTSDKKEMDMETKVKELDSAIASFVKSKMFANISVISPADASECRKRLLKVLYLSEELSAMAKK